MGLNIVVCVKPIPDPEKYNEITIDPVNKTIVREGIPTIINPIDKHAIEEALKIKEQYGGKVILMSMAPPNAKETIQEGLAMGADEAYLLSDKKFAGADTLATSYVLAQGIKKIGGADLVLTGTESGDGATAQVSSQLGEWLDLPHLWGVIECNIKNPDDIYIKTKIENGYMEWAGRLPMVMAVSREINKPRYTTIMGVMKAKKKPFTILTFADLELDENYVGLAGSPTQPGEIFTPEIGRKGELVKGSKEELVQFIIEKLRANGINVEKFTLGCEGGQN
ncbi:MAG: electron transfer flavoprotein beta subunit [Clostridia bacterium]|nr:electron transfer flavoprotein beta subunit [Clostridia bacterium]MDN5321981.1 electron transfer flavoprotein beta subunit [Clostridia bacterium]